MPELAKSTCRAMRRHHRRRRMRARTLLVAPFHRTEESRRGFVLRTIDLHRPRSCGICKASRMNIDGPDDRTLRQVLREGDEGC